MNIFNVLSQGKSRLHEPAISAMLGFLLGTHRDHGLGDSFLRAFLTLLQSKASVPLVKALMDRPFIDTDVSLEEPYQLGNLRKDIDIEISILNREKNETCRLVVENKIKVGAANPKQLSEYYQAILEDDQNIPTLVMVFLTPKTITPALEQEFAALNVRDGHHKVWLFWDDGQQGILGIIQDILTKESRGEIPPINEYMRHTLKAFVLHIRSVIGTGIVADLRFGQDIGDIVEEIEVQLADGARYRMVRRDSGQIQVYAGDEKVMAKAVLQRVIRERGLDIPIVGNTRQMGKRVIEMLKSSS